MLKTMFIGSKNEFDELIVHWLSKNTELVGVVWTESTAWQRTWRGRLQFTSKRLRRYGLTKVLDEALFFLFYHTFMLRKEEKELHSSVIEPYLREHGHLEWGGDSVFATDVNREEVLEFVSDHQPDLCFAMCINQFFGKKLRSIPRHGVFLWHEGITPEYKGLYSPFWAVKKLDFERIGYTLLRMNDKWDAGEIYIQGKAQDIDPFRHGHLYSGHKAIFDSLAEVHRFLEKLERGDAMPIKRENAKHGYYTYPGISDFIWQRLSLRRRRVRANDASMNQSIRSGATLR